MARVLYCADCDCAVWREAIQLSTSGPGEVDVVCFPWAGRACLGTGNMQIYLFLCFSISHRACFPAFIVIYHVLLFICLSLLCCELVKLPFDPVRYLFYGLGYCLRTQ